MLTSLKRLAVSASLAVVLAAALVVPGLVACRGPEAPLPAVAPPTSTPTPTPPSVPSSTLFRYSGLDSTGEATTPGTYAFLATPGDATSLTTAYPYAAARASELRIHPTDAGGASNAAFYDKVRVGQNFEYRTHGTDCGVSLKVTRVESATIPRIFGIERMRGYGGRCSTAGARAEFVWRPPPGDPVPGAVGTLDSGEIVEEGWYRLYEKAPWMMYVPAGAQVMFCWVIQNDSPDPSTEMVLCDVVTGSELIFDVSADSATFGGKTRRRVVSPEAHAVRSDPSLYPARRYCGIGR